MSDIFSEAQDEHVPSPPPDPHDSTYSEPVPNKKQRVPGKQGVPKKTQDDTPDQRKGIGEGFSDAAKRRVQKATEPLAKLRCLITNAPEIYAVEYAHILPRATELKVLERLEYSWGMRYGTFNVDTRYNLIRLNAALHTLFDSSQWILLPGGSILDNFVNRQERPDPNFMTLLREPATYQYKFIPADDLCAFEIRRYSAPVETLQKVGPADFEPSYYYPFDNFPTITSHAHPHFVICNIALKMQKEAVNFLELDDSHIRTMLKKTVRIFRKWTAEIPASSDFYHTPFVPATNDDNNSVFTQAARRDTRGFRRSVGKSSPTISTHASKNSRKRARVLEATHGLSFNDKTPRVLDDDPRLRGRLKWKQFVSAWVSSMALTSIPLELPFVQLYPRKFISLFYVLQGVGITF